MAKVDIWIEADKLGLSLEKLAIELHKQFEDAVAHTAQVAYSQIVAKAQYQLNSTSADYLNGLFFEKLGENEYLIALTTPMANALEDGYPGFDMKPGLLGSKKTVASGSRAGQPWVRTSKKGKKFAAVPFEHKPFSKAAKGMDAHYNQIIRGFSAINQSGRKQKFTSIFNDASGNPLEGKVATMKNTGFKDLDNLVKYQKNYVNEQTGKTTTQSLYVTYRMVGEDSDGWQHPGFAGLHAFREAEEYVRNEIQRILQDFLG